MDCYRLSRGPTRLPYGVKLSHSNNTSMMAFKKHYMMILYNKCSYLERKQKELHLLLKKWPKIILEEVWRTCWSEPLIYATRSSRLFHKMLHHMTKYHWSFCSQHSTSSCFHNRGNMSHMKDLANHKVGDIHRMKSDF